MSIPKKEIAFHRTFSIINPEGRFHTYCSQKQSQQMSETDLCAWSQLLHTGLHKQTHTMWLGHAHTQWLCVISLSLKDRITTYSHPHQDRSAGTELWESQLCEGHVAQHRKIYYCTDTHIQAWSLTLITTQTYKNYSLLRPRLSRHASTVTQTELHIIKSQACS